MECVSHIVVERSYMISYISYHAIMCTSSFLCCAD